MTMSAQDQDNELHQLALKELVPVLGEGRARELLISICQKDHLTLATADELFRFAGELSKLGGHEGVLGALLSVRAIMHGAKVR